MTGGEAGPPEGAKAGPTVAEAGGGQAGPAPATAGADPVTAAIEAGFREAAAEAVRRAFAAGLPIATLDAAGAPVWRWADGEERPIDDPTGIPDRRGRPR